MRQAKMTRKPRTALVIDIWKKIHYKNPILVGVIEAQFGEAARLVDWGMASGRVMALDVGKVRGKVALSSTRWAIPRSR